MRIRNLVSIILSGILIANLSGCMTIGPVAVIDDTGLGQSAVAKAIHSALLVSSENRVNYHVEKLLAEKGIINMQDRRPEMEALGFACANAPSTLCTYTGTMKLSLRNVSDELIRANRILKSVEIIVDWEKTPVKIVSVIKVGKY